MTVWDILDNILKILPPIAAVLFLLAAGIIFAIGFFRHGVNFIKYGFKQMVLDSSLEKRFDNLEAKFAAKFNDLEAKFAAKFNDLGARIDGLHTEIDGIHAELGGLHAELGAIKVNHFGHLKDFLTELTSILLDKNVINNQDKARLDNRLRGM